MSSFKSLETISFFIGEEFIFEKHIYIHGQNYKKVKLLWIQECFPDEEDSEKRERNELATRDPFVKNLCASHQ